MCHFKETGDPKILRVSALRHGDKSLLTMLSAFIHNEQIERCNYLTMTRDELEKLSLRKGVYKWKKYTRFFYIYLFFWDVDRMLIAREMGAKVIKKNEMPTALSTFYREVRIYIVLMEELDKLIYAYI